MSRVMARSISESDGLLTANPRQKTIEVGAKGTILGCSRLYAVGLCGVENGGPFCGPTKTWAGFSSLNTNRENHLPELDGIRGIACLQVVLLHCAVGLTDALHPTINSFLTTIVSSGVDLFFVLSGFLIVGILFDNRKSRNYFRVFWSRRALRIFPVYFLLLATYLVALSIRGPILNLWLLKDTMPPWTYAMFVQNYAMAENGNLGSYWVGITWSLAIEEQFYLVVPLLVFLLSRSQMLGLAVACIVIAPIFRCWPGASWYWSYMVTPCRMDALMFGVAVACIIRDERLFAFFKRWRPLLDLFWLAVIVGLFQGAFNITIAPMFYFSVVALIYAYCILRIFLADDWLCAALRWRALTWLGGISYPLYMYHQAINGLLHGLLFGKGPAIFSWAQLAVAFFVIATSILLAWVSTRYFEMPFRQRGRTIRYARTPTVEAA